MLGDIEKLIKFSDFYFNLIVFNIKIEKHLRKVDFCNKNEDVADVFKRIQKNKIARGLYF